jgi:hypothetical protein
MLALKTSPSFAVWESTASIMRTTNSVCAGIGAAGAGDAAGCPDAAEASGVARRSTGRSLSPGVEADDEDAVESEDAEESDGRRNVGRLLSEDEDEDADEDESGEDEADEDRFNVGRESSEGIDDPEEGYDPESFGSGWRITGREPVLRELELEPEPESELELDPEPESGRRRVGRPSSRGVSRELVYPPLLNSIRAISPTSMVWMLSPTSTLIWRGVPPR